MDRRRLRYFVMVAEELNFTRAAARLHVAQPAVSVQIRNLETEIGAQLLARDNRNVALTEAGRIFLAQARQMLALASQSVDMARRASTGEIGHLSIAYSNPAGFRVFPKIVPAFKRAKPDVHLTFHDLTIPQQIDQLRRNELDVGFVWLPLPTDEFDVQALAQEPYMAAVPADHRLASAPTVSIKELSQEPLILVPRSVDPESRHQIDDLFRRAAARMNIAYELDTLLSILGFVAMGCGCSILPDFVRRLPREGVVYKRLRGSNLIKTLAIIKRKDAGRLAEAFFGFTVNSVLPLFAARRSGQHRHD